MRNWEKVKSWFIALCIVIIIAVTQFAFWSMRCDVEKERLMAKNLDVVSTFLRHSALEGVISTDGKELKSYGVVIARWDGDEIVMPDSSVYRSVTTTKHRNLLRSMALEKGVVVKEVN